MSEEQVSLWLWRYRDPRTNYWKRLTVRMTEADAATWASRNLVKLEKVVNSGEHGVPGTALWNLPSKPKR